MVHLVREAANPYHDPASGRFTTGPGGVTTAEPPVYNEPTTVDALYDSLTEYGQFQFSDEFVPASGVRGTDAWSTASVWVNADGTVTPVRGHQSVEGGFDQAMRDGRVRASLANDGQLNFQLYRPMSDDQRGALDRSLERTEQLMVEQRERYGDKPIPPRVIPGGANTTVWMEVMDGPRQESSPIWHGTYNEPGLSTLYHQRDYPSFELLVGDANRVASGGQPAFGPAARAEALVSVFAANPYHDPKSGKFTHSPGGKGSGGGGSEGGSEDITDEIIDDLEPPTDSFGDCFPSAVHEVMADPSLTLVHGLPLGTGGDVEGKRYWHAWAERRLTFQRPGGGEAHIDIVYDSSNNNNIEMPADMYYDLGHIEQTWRYTQAEMKAKLDEFGHYGPWAEGWEGMEETAWLSLTYAANPYHKGPGPGGGQFDRKPGGAGSGSPPLKGDDAEVYLDGVHSDEWANMHLKQEYRDAVDTWNDMNSFVDIQSHLRGSHWLASEKKRATAEALADLTRSNKLDRSVIAYQGLDPLAFENVPDDFSPHDLVGMRLTDPGLTTTTLSAAWAANFTRGSSSGVVVEMEVPAGTGGVWLDNFTSSKGKVPWAPGGSEKELLLEQGLTIEITGIGGRMAYDSVHGVEAPLVTARVVKA